MNRKKTRRIIIGAVLAAVLLTACGTAGLLYVKIYREAAPTNRSLLFNYRVKAAEGGADSSEGYGSSAGIKQPAAMRAADETAELSVDDFIEAFRDLTDNADEYGSVFENETFAFLKEMHDLFGIRVTCYCYFSQDDFSLDECTDVFRREFEACSDWLKFGFHAENKWSDYTGGDCAEKLAADYVKTVKELERIAGAASIDTVIRLSMFASTEEGAAALASLPEDSYPVAGLLTADDGRLSYGLGPENSAAVAARGELCDEETGITYYSTDLRAEYIVLPALKLREIEKAVSEGGHNDIRMFSHEWKLDEVLVRYNIRKMLKGLSDLP